MGVHASSLNLLDIVRLKNSFTKPDNALARHSLE